MTSFLGATLASASTARLHIVEISVLLVGTSLDLGPLSLHGSLSTLFSKASRAQRFSPSFAIMSLKIPELKV